MSSTAPGEVPVRLHLVAGLVIVLRRVLLLLALAEVGRLADVLPSPLGIERGDALLGELEMVGAVVIALLGSASGATVRPCAAAIATSRSSSVV